MTGKQTIINSLQCGCPKCGQPSIFSGRLTLNVKDRCDSCGLALKDHDSGDGPAVFLIFILGFLLVPLALLTDALFTVPLGGHALLWTCVAIGICLFTMQPLKAYVMALNFKHRGDV